MSDSELLHEINDAIGAHRAWNLALRNAVITGNCDMSSHAASSTSRCKFGQWLHSSMLSTALKDGEPYQVVKRLHADFHRSVGEVLEAIQSGQRLLAKDRLQGDFAERSDALVRALTKWKIEVGTH